MKIIEVKKTDYLLFTEEGDLFFTINQSLSYFFKGIFCEFLDHIDFTHTATAQLQNELLK